MTAGHSDPFDDVFPYPSRVKYHSVSFSILRSVMLHKYNLLYKNIKWVMELIQIWGGDAQNYTK